MKTNSFDFEIREIESDLYRITLPQPLYEANQVYLIKDERPLLIDSGYIDSIGNLAMALKSIGLSLNKIHTCIYTHNHIDHISAGLLFSTYAKKMKKMGHHKLEDVSDYLLYFHSWVTENERLLKLAFNDEKERAKREKELRNRWYEFLKHFENPSKKIGDRYIHLDKGLEEGDVINTGKYNFKIIETPGHNKWHITLLEEKMKWLFSGDLVIGNIPAIYNSLEGSLKDYIASMNRLLQYDDYAFFPGHGDVITSPKKKIKIMLRTISMLERSILKKVTSTPIDLYNLTQQIIGKAAHYQDALMVSMALMESILRKLLKENKLQSTLYHNGYEVYFEN